MKNILIVDDDRAVLEVLGRALVGYRVRLAFDPEEALRIAVGLVSLDLLITDFMMPEMMGDELSGRLRAVRPNLKVLILTGHSDLLEREKPPWWTTEPHLAKPVELGRLQAVVAELIGPPEEA
jgi:two-component system cell cycle sensor histidine kinase/response regulator CckA